MGKILIFTIALFSTAGVSAQQLLLEAFTGRSLTDYKESPYTNNNNSYTPLGARLAAGSDHLQLGAEYSQNLTNPFWSIKDEATGDLLGEHKFNTTFYGVFLRSKIAKYPARRFGVTLRVGAGYFDTKRESTVPGEPASASFDKTLGLNGGIGASIPLVPNVMIELAYNYYMVNYDATAVLPKLQGNYHSLQVGLSLDFVFGKRAQKYQELKRR